MDLFTALGTSQHYFSACKDEQHDFRVLHLEDESRKKFRLIVTSCELVLLFLERLEFDAEADVAARYYVLNLKISHRDREHQGLTLLRSCLFGALFRSAIEYLLDSFLKDFAGLHGTVL